MAQTISTLKDVVDWGLCTGCGACSVACERNGGISLVNVNDDGIRPHFDMKQCGDCDVCLPICPGYAIDGDRAVDSAWKKQTRHHEFGRVLEIWDGYANNAEIRRRASSGGLLTALALFCLEQEGMRSVIHTGMDPERPWLNRTVRSRTRAELMQTTGSRYAPSSPCEGLADIEAKDAPAVFIGKPCDTAAAISLADKHPELHLKLGLVLTFFCAGTPCTDATLEMLSSMGVAPEQVRELHYRGDGWPGGFKVHLKNGNGANGDGPFLPYEEAWARLATKRPLRCHLCPDGLGRVADLACGDGWHRRDESDNPGHSLVLVRTPRGQRILEGARAAGYIELQPAGAPEVLKAQENLLGRRRLLWGRLAAMRMLTIPVPHFRHFGLRRSWRNQPLSKRLRTLLGTIRRALRRGWWKRRGSTAKTRRDRNPRGAVRRQAIPEGNTPR